MSSDRIGVIIQARMGSTRLPGKILMPIGNNLLLEHILYRTRNLRNPVTVVIATSVSPLDDVVEVFSASHAIASFRGSEQNVLDRYYRCALSCGFGQIVRLTGDNPFPDIVELDRLIDLHLSGAADYTSSLGNLPVGVGAEIFTLDTLEKSWRFGTQPHHIEHVDEYMLEHPEIFSSALLTVPAAKNRPDIRLTVDTETDYRRACYIVAQSGTEYVTTLRAIELAERFEMMDVAP